MQGQAVTNRASTRLQRILVWVSRLFLAAALAMLLFQLAIALELFITHAQITYDFPYSLDYGEGPLLDQVARLARFQNIYPADPLHPPYTITNYPPVYAMVQVPFYWLFGPHFWYGRLISLVSVLAAAVFIGLTLHAITKSITGSLVAGLLLLAMPFVMHWAPLTRVDSLALGLSWAGLYVVVRHEERRWGLVAGAALLAAAIFTRQSSGLAAPLAAFVWLIHKQPRQRALLLAAWVAAIAGTAFFVLTLFTGGGFFFHIVTANVNPFYWRTVANYANDFRTHLPVLMFGSALFALSFLAGKPRSWWLVTPYLLGGLATAVTIGKDGSNVNYLYELSAALCLVAGALIAWTGKRYALTALVVLLLVPQAMDMVNWSRADFYDRSMLPLVDQPGLKRLEDMVREADGPVLADEWMGHLAVTGRPVVYQPFEYKMLQEAGVWDQQPFLESIENHEYSLILLYEPPYWDSRNSRWTPEMLRTIETSYRRTIKVAHTAIYEPRE